jgi:hypothetical protein
VFPILIFLAAATFFGPAQFWTIVGVALTAIGLLGGWIAKMKTGKRDKKTDSLSLYIHFVDDLQVELKRLHDLLTEERAESARALREKDLIIERLEMKILALQQERDDG